MEKWKDFIQINFCEEGVAIQHLQPYHLRLLSKVENRLEVLPKGYDEEDEREESAGADKKEKKE